MSMVWVSSGLQARKHIAAIGLLAATAFLSGCTAQTNDSRPAWNDPAAKLYPVEIRSHSFSVSPSKQKGPPTLTWEIATTSEDFVKPLPKDIIPRGFLTGPQGRTALLAQDRVSAKPGIYKLTPSALDVERCPNLEFPPYDRWSLTHVTNISTPFLFVYDGVARAHDSIPISWQDGAACPNADPSRRSVLPHGGGGVDTRVSPQHIGSAWYLRAGEHVLAYDINAARWTSINHQPGYRAAKFLQTGNDPTILWRRGDLSSKIDAALQPLWVETPLQKPTHGSAQKAVNQSHRFDDTSPMDALTRAVRAMDPTGLWDLGNTNSEGRLSWRQIYSVQAFLDIAEFPEAFEPLRQSDPAQFDALHARLALEWTSLQDTVCTGSLEPYTTPRYSLGREPFHAAVNIGRLAEVFGRYEVVSGTRLPENCWSALIPALTRLEGTWEEYAVAGNQYTDFVPKGRVFLRRRKGVAFIRDGNNLPFNHVNNWITGVLWAIKAGRFELDGITRTAIADAWQTFNEHAYLPVQPEQAFAWRYNWGFAYTGWTAENNISENRPDFDGTQSPAHPSYRMMDVQALLLSLSTAPDLVTFDTAPFYERVALAAKDNELGIFTLRHSADFLRAGLTDVPSNTSSEHQALLRAAAHPVNLTELRSSLWAAAKLAQISGNDPAVNSAE